MSNQVREELERIAKAHDGTITPQLVLDAARDPASPLHEYFEWNIKKAATEYWLDQARTLIRSVRIVVTSETRKFNAVAYVRDPRVKEGDQGYISIPRLRTDGDLAHEAIVAEFMRVTSALRRAREIALSLNIDATQIEELEQRCFSVQESLDSQLNG